MLFALVSGDDVHFLYSSKPGFRRMETICLQLWHGRPSLFVHAYVTEEDLYFLPWLRIPNYYHLLFASIYLTPIFPTYWGSDALPKLEVFDRLESLKLYFYPLHMLRLSV